MCIYNVLFIHSSSDGHLGCFHLLAIVNSTAMNMDVGHGPLWSSVSEGLLLDDIEVCFITFLLIYLHSYERR